uniref:E3 ubiquitin-protein ligase ubr3 isoform X6 n=1 Tax=Pristiophorus japonicus TaxID=55135 RepID=UPI00398E92C3
MAVSLLRRDKRSAAASLKAECSRPDGRGVQLLNDLLDSVLSPERALAEAEVIEWCKCLIAGGESFDDFCKMVCAYDNATLCGLVWTANFVAYRCRTCGISPCMSLCAECFNAGEHTGHDFNMFRSQAGGACDCGDSSVMRDSGFCKRHRSTASLNIPSVPNELMMMSEHILPRVILRLVQHLRDGYSEPVSDPATERDLQKTLQQMDPLISLLEDLTKMGGATRSILTRVLANHQIYKDLCSGDLCTGEKTYAKKNYEKYLAALKGSGLVTSKERSVTSVLDQMAGASNVTILGATAGTGQMDSSDEEEQDGNQRVGKRKRVELCNSTKDPSIMDILKHKCFLEEILFWTVKYEFPQKMVTFLLNMLPDQDYKPAPNQVTFHLPLHRYYAMFLSKAIRCQQLDLDSLLPDQEMLMKMMVHPLQIQASLSEIHSNMWVRNGLQIKGQAMTYVQSHFCNSMIDPDIFLLQVCASRLDPDYFVSSVFERFKVVDLLTMASQHQNAALDTEHERSMLEGALTFLVILLSLRIHLGMTDDEILRAEMVAQLCMSDRTHSTLLDLIPENPNPKSGIIPGSYYFENMLSAVADFKAPVFEPGGSMQQGMYTPKADVWNQEFDPIMVILRTVYRRDVQSAMDRYMGFLKQTGKFCGNPWPPYRERAPLNPSYKGLMRILHCKTLHIVLFTLLYKMSMDHQNMSEHILCMVLYLIELGLDNLPEETVEEEEMFGEERCSDSWFHGTNIATNLNHVINYVRVRVPETAPEVTREPPASTSSDTSSFVQGSRRATALNRESSNTAQVFSLVAERRRKFQEIINRNSDNAIQNADVRPKTSKWTAPSSTPQLTTAILEVRESMLSLLIKLHYKLSGKQNSYYPFWLEDSESTSRLDPMQQSHGDGTTAVERILIKTAARSRQNKCSIEEICRKVAPPVPPKKNSSADKKALDKEERRQKARERQQKLLAEFASRQKSFMETAMDLESPDSDVAMDIGSSEQQDSETVYDCVICGQSGPSTEERPTGLVVLLQASSVLGHRRRSTEPKKLPTSDEEQIYPEDTCGTAHDVRITDLQQYFKDSSCLQSVSIGWEGGVYVQTCGHTLHIDCHKSYMESLRNDQVLQSFSVDKGEFTCPLCRQFANSVLPCYPEKSEEKSIWSPYISKTLQALIEEVEEQQEQLGMFPVSISSVTNLSKEMESVMKDIKNTTQKKYIDYGKTPGSPDNDFLFMYSVARLNLELELVHRGGNLCLGGASATTKRSCLNQLLHVLAMHMRLFRIDSAYNPWTRLTRLTQVIDSGICDDEKPEVPLLYRDISSLLLILVLTMPQELHKEHFTCIVKVLYNLLYTQAIATLSVRFSEEERTAWKNSGKLKIMCNSDKSWEVLLSHIIGELSKGKLYCASDTDQVSMLSTSVWSPQSIEYSIQQFCLPFLRTTSLLQHHLFGDDLPNCQRTEEEFGMLASYLGLLLSSLQSSDEANSSSCLEWPVAALDIISQWCSEVMTSAESHSEQVMNLLVQDPQWSLPCLLQLPENYNTIFQYYHRKACVHCSKVPKDPALCLVCGTFVCLKGQCCKQQSYCECVLHSQNCGAGTGIFLLINASVIIVIRGHRFCLWGSVYLDTHGEEDRDLRRGKPLYLCSERYKVLEQQWVTHTFDHINKRWGAHYNGL